MNSEMDRREFLVGGTKLFAAAVLTPSIIAILEGCSEPEVSQEVYSGDLYALEGKTLISESRLSDLLKELTHSGDPMLTKIGRKVKNLHYRDELASLPDIVNPLAVPIPISRDYSDVLSFVEIYAPDETESDFLYGTQEDGERYPYSDSAVFGINIGVNNSFDSRENIEESLFLAKEGLTSLLFFRLSEEYQYNFSGNNIFRNLDGSRITNPSLLAKAGLKMGLLDIRDRNTLFSKVADLAPVFLMVPSLKYLVEEGRIPKDSDILGGFYIAANLVNSDPELEMVVERLSDLWVNSNGLTGPNGFTNELMDPKLLDAIDIMHEKVYSSN